MRNNDGTLTFSNVTGGRLTPDNIPSVTILNGFVYERSENLIKTNQFAFGAASADVADVSWNDETFRFTNILSSVQVVVVDFKDKTVKTGSVNDILDYKNFKENCSRVLMRFRSGTLNELIVFNN